MSRVCWLIVGGEYGGVREGNELLKRSSTSCDEVGEGAETRIEGWDEGWLSRVCVELLVW